jgi:uncharacterized protein YoxC
MGENVVLSTIVGVALAVAILILIGFAVSALIQLKKTLESVNTLVGSVDDQLGPLLADLHDTVRQANVELERIDDVVFTVIDISEKVSATTSALHGLVSSPMIKVASISAGAKGAINKLVGRK